MIKKLAQVRGLIRRRNKVIKALIAIASEILSNDGRKDWFVEFLRDLGVALMVGAILSGLIGEMMHKTALFLLMVALLLCYTSLLFATTKLC